MIPPACRLALVLGFAVFVGGCASQPTPHATEPPVVNAPLLLISLDGVNPDYLERGLTPNLGRIAREGVRARWMTPSYPSLTFPNHYTLITGLRPDHHGIVHNTMRDAALGQFFLSKREAVADGRWWGGEPLWVTLEKSGQRTATMFWPGSEAEIAGMRPSRWMPFDDTISIDARVDRVLGWLAEPPAQRPRLTTLYFEHVDHAGHDYGPDSTQTDDALRAIDAGIGRLLSTLEARGQLDAINLVVVSDHGMAPGKVARTLALETLVADDVAEAVTTGEVVGFQPRPGREAEAETQLLRTRPHLQCWRKGELPARWHYGTHPRIPPIVCQTEEGWSVLREDRIRRWREAGGADRGDHGFDPALPSMRAIFLARGPAFRRGAVLPGFDNVDVYPLLARLVGTTPQPNDGNPATLLPALKGR